MSSTGPAVDLRVLNLLNSDRRRGAEAFGVDLGQALADRGVAVRTMALASSDPAARHDVETVFGAGRRGPAALVHLVRAARAADVLVGHGGRTLFVGVALGVLARRPFVYRVIGEPAMWAQQGLRRRRVRAALRRASAVVVYYPELAGVLVSTFGVEPDRIHTIVKGLDVARFPLADGAQRADARATAGLTPDDGGPVVVYLGALEPKKNVQQVVRAVARIDGARLIVVGDGGCRDGLELLAGELDVDATFVGPTAQPWPYLALADVVGLTSETEGVPTVLLEAALVGVGTVATPVGGVGSVVIDGVTGRLVPVGDVEATATAIREVAARRGELGPVARQRALGRHDITSVAEEWHRLLLSRKARCGEH
jgi:glycosyltransferase involved in cell wall biosynthesis